MYLTIVLKNTLYCCAATNNTCNVNHFKRMRFVVHMEVAMIIIAFSDTTNFNPIEI